MTDFERIIKDAFQESEEASKRFELEMEKASREMNRSLTDFHALVASGHIRHASKREYEAWLKGFLINGGKPTHAYDYNMPTDRLFIALADLVLPSLFGAAAISLIIPNGVTVFGLDKFSHNTIYFMDGFTANKTIVPVYKDTVIK